MKKAARHPAQALHLISACKELPVSIMYTGLADNVCTWLYSCTISCGIGQELEEPGSRKEDEAQLAHWGCPMGCPSSMLATTGPGSATWTRNRELRVRTWNLI